MLKYFVLIVQLQIWPNSRSIVESTRSKLDETKIATQ